MSRPFKLYRLQQIDSKLDGMRVRLREIERALSDDTFLQNANIHERVAEENLQQARKALRGAEDYVRQQNLKIEQSESTLYGGKVRNPKELQDLQNEVAALKRYKSVLEDRQLEAMVMEEEALAIHQQASGELENARSKSATEHSMLNAEMRRLLKDIARFEEERQATVSSVNPEDLRIYEQIRQKRRGIAVSKVSNKTCSACGSTLNTALMHASRSPNEINRCDACGRILYAG